MINQVIEKTMEVLKKDPSFFNVREWRKINGLVPSKYHAISIGCDDENFTEYTNELDECNSMLKIYASLDNKELSGRCRQQAEDRLEYGERIIREIAENIKLALTDNCTLGGLIDSSMVEKIEFVTADEHVDLHIAVISFSVKYYTERSKNLRSITMLMTPSYEGSETLVMHLPITPVIDATIAGLVKGKDYQVVTEGIRFTLGIPIEQYLVTWQYEATSAKVDKYGMIVNDEIHFMGRSD